MDSFPLVQVMTALSYIVALPLHQLLAIMIIAFQLGYIYGKNSIAKRPKKKYQLLPALMCSQPTEPQEQKTNSQPNSTEDPRAFLEERVTLQGNKISSRSYFQIKFQQSVDCRYLRKIEKHQLITDYENNKEGKCIEYQTGKHKEFYMPNMTPNIITTVNIYQNQQQKYKSYTQKRLISLQNVDLQAFHRCFCQNDKFVRMFNNHRKIGVGSYGTVFQAQNILDRQNYAIKRIFVKGLTNISKIRKEILLISGFYHPNIVRFYQCWVEQSTLQEQQAICKADNQAKSWGRKSLRFQNSSNNNSSSLKVVLEGGTPDSDIVFQGSKKQLQLVEQKGPVNSTNKDNSPQCYSIYIQMELCTSGTLASYLAQRIQVDRRICFQIFQQLVNGVIYLHGKGVVHRDLKPANILFSSKQKLVKIGDFGLAESFLAKGESFCAHAGTPCYIAPQFLGKKVIPSQRLQYGDVYALGAIYYEMLNLTFTTIHQKFDKLNRLKDNKVDLDPSFRRQIKAIKILTRINRPDLINFAHSKQYQELQKTYG